MWAWLLKLALVFFAASSIVRNDWEQKYKTSKHWKQKKLAELLFSSNVPTIYCVLYQVCCNSNEYWNLSQFQVFGIKWGKFYSFQIPGKSTTKKQVTAAKNRQSENNMNVRSILKKWNMSKCFIIFSECQTNLCNDESLSGNQQGGKHFCCRRHFCMTSSNLPILHKTNRLSDKT